MSYREALDFLYGLQRFGIKLGLNNIRELLVRLDHPERCCSFVHVAGTNGKGSVCAALARTLQEAGVRTGLYTSPHLHCFTERIRVDGHRIPPQTVVDLVCEMRQLAQGLPATFFEFATAMALRYFQGEGVDWAILEVGMGGRLDATNAVTPALCIITPVSLDHAEHLGADLSAIAREKAGIIKPHVPVVVGHQEPAALLEIEAAAARQQAPLYLAGRDFDVRPAGRGFDYLGPKQLLEGLQPSLSGRHQHENLALALAALEVLQQKIPGLNQGVRRRGIESVQWPGRLEIVPGTPPVLLDGAHNPAGAQALATHLRELGHGPLPWVVGLSGARSPEALLGPWLPYMSEVLVVEPSVENVVPAADITAFLQCHRRSATVCDSPAQALAMLRHNQRQAPLAVVAGSLYLVAELRGLLFSDEDGLW